MPPCSASERCGAGFGGSAAAEHLAVLDLARLAVVERLHPLDLGEDDKVAVLLQADRPDGISRRCWLCTNVMRAFTDSTHLELDALVLDEGHHARLARGDVGDDSLAGLLACAEGKRRKKVRQDLNRRLRAGAVRGRDAHRRRRGP